MESRTCRRNLASEFCGLFLRVFRLNALLFAFTIFLSKCLSQPYLSLISALSEVFVRQTWAFVDTALYII